MKRNMKFHVPKHLSKATLTLMASTLILLAPSQAEAADFPANPLDKPGWTLDRHDEFEGPTLDDTLWVDKYLEWRTETERSQAEYIFRDGKLVLQIDEDKLSYRPNETIWVSGIQTGDKDYLHLNDLNHSITENIKYAPKYGYFEIRAKTQKGSGHHCAFWTTGIRNEPWQEVEFDILEHPGGNPYSAMMNIHPWDDPNAYDSGGYKNMGFDMTEGFHIYAMEWDENGVKYYVDNQLKKTYNYSPDYGMIFFLTLYQGADWTGSIDTSQPYPKEFEIDYFRAYKKDSSTPVEPTTVIVDNGATGHTESGSGWKSSSLKGYLNSSTRYIDASNSPTGFSKWTPSLAEGDYSVYAWYPSYHNSATQATYTVTHSGGTSDVTVDQSNTGGNWQLIGTYHFNTGTQGYVTLSVAPLTAPNSNIRADAIKFEPVQ